MPGSFSISRVDGEAGAQAVGALMAAYRQIPELRLTPVRFEQDAAALLATYGRPDGGLFLARLPDGTPCGCVALRRFDRESCELKRLYVSPQGRGLGLGRALMETAITRARELDYRQVKLDSVPEMTTALGLYRRLGFRPIPPFGTSPVTELVFFGLDL